MQIDTVPTATVNFDCVFPTYREVNQHLFAILAQLLTQCLLLASLEQTMSWFAQAWQRLPLQGPL